MLRNLDLIRSVRCRSAAAALSLALVAAGCSGGSGLGSLGGSSTASAPPPAPADSQPAANPSFKDKVSSFFGGSSAKDPQQVTGSQIAQDCPGIDIRQGASTLKVGTTGTVTGSESDDNGAMALKYQGTFVRAARECALVAGQLVMKIGVEGRIIVGPAGGPGQIVVPLRIAVVQETTGGTKPIVTKFIQIPVTIASSTDNPTFTHVEEGLSFPMPPDLDDYVVYIGFDPLSLQPQQHPAAKPKPKAKHPAGT
jgi:hypothetical protein